MATAAKKSAASAAKAKAAANAVAEGKGDLYDVLSNLDHDGKRYGLGDQLALDGEAAEPLLACGAVKLADAPAQ